MMTCKSAYLQLSPFLRISTIQNMYSSIVGYVRIVGSYKNSALITLAQLKYDGSLIAYQISKSTEQRDRNLYGRWDLNRLHSKNTHAPRYRTFVTLYFLREKDFKLDFLYSIKQEKIEIHISCFLKPEEGDVLNCYGGDRLHVAKVITKEDFNWQTSRVFTQAKNH